MLKFPKKMPSPYDFHLPPHLIAQYPPVRRDGGRLLQVDEGICPFIDLPQRLRRGDLCDLLEISIC